MLPLPSCCRRIGSFWPRTPRARAKASSILSTLWRSNASTKARRGSPMSSASRSERAVFQKTLRCRCFGRTVRASGDPHQAQIPDCLCRTRLPRSIEGTEILHRGRLKTVTRAQRRALRQRKAVESAIRHLKENHGMRRCWLKGTTGDALHAALCACAYNLCWLLRRLALLWPRLRQARICLLISLS